MELVKKIESIVTEQVREAIQDGEVINQITLDKYLMQIQGDPISYINGLIYTKDLNQWITSYPLDFMSIFFQHFNPAGDDGRHIKSLDKLVINVISVILNCIYLDFDDFVTDEEDEDDGNY